ncbi:helix-turn-helix domain-containing protein [Sphingomonas sp. RIT328]|uniref:helix-turn-helix domain-containing protein n=1 Tax=Sphingomonas sp. RIT328 TaxID=1470591 RepID=UPI00044637E7|nr:helix-turn-helix domain-containing protein [Sphingomonas sp. RIT328]EZP53350.1 IclR helix-turn-helix domain protein [Sphingomonas sp. RIT328]
MPVAHCVSTTTGIILGADSGFCRLLQRPHAALIGASYRSITVTDDLDKSAAMLDTLVDKAAPTQLRKHYWRPDGGIVAVDLLVSRFDAAGLLVSTLSWVEDAGATPQRLWQAALRLRHLYALRMEAWGRDLFGDYPGLILLALYLAEAEGRPATLADIAAATTLTPGSVERWLRVLVQRGFVAPRDGSELIQLGHAGLATIERLLTAALAPLP